MRRWFVIGGAVGCGLIAVVSIAAFVYFDRLGEWAVRSEVIPTLEARLGTNVAIGSLDVGRRAVVLEDVAVGGSDEPLVTASRVRIEYSLRSVLRRRPEIGLVQIEGARAQVRGDGDAERALQARLAASPSEAPAGAGGRASRAIFPERVELVDAALSLRDEDAGVTVSMREIEGEIAWGGDASLRIGHLGVVARAGPTGSASDVVVTAALADPVGTAVIGIGDGRVSVAGGISLTAIRGELRSDVDGRLDVDLTGSYGGATERLWSARGWVDPRARTGDLAIEAERFTLDRIAHVLEGSPIRRPDQAAIGASLRLEVGADLATFAGDVDIAGLSVAHRMLATTPVVDLDMSARVSGQIDRLANALALDEAEIEIEGVRYELEGFVHLPGGIDPITGRVRERPRLGARAKVAPVACQAMLESIPEALVPRLQGFELSGEFAADLHVDIDLEVIDATRLEGGIGIHGCQVVRAPPPMSAARLREPFVHRIKLGEDEWLRVGLGPENPDFVPLEEVSPHLVNALMTTEDSGFFSHDGFVRRQFRTALVRNLESGYFRYGASSITMQMVKNVLLHNEKTLSRKLQELFLTWYLETVLDKERIMEIYVNAIEFGPGLYGIGPASRHYFGTSARELNPVESAFFSSILPNPKGRYRQFCRGELSRWTQGKIERVVDLMYERERLTAIEHQIAQHTPLFFDRSHLDSEASCLQRVRRAIERAPSTTPVLEKDDPDELAQR